MSYRVRYSTTYTFAQHHPALQRDNLSVTLGRTEERYLLMIPDGEKRDYREA